MTVNITTLDNGLRVVSDAVPHVETVTVGTWVDVGSRHESAAENGLSHMLEHMAFKGTKRRDALQIAEEIENVGGYLNAYTSREHTTYYARLLKQDLALGVDVIADILQHSTFDGEELERERGVIIQEIGQADDTPDDVVFDLMQEAAYPDQPLGRPILGTSDLLGSFTRDDLNHYMSKHYKAEQMAVVASGNLEHDEFVRMVEDHYGDLERTRERATSEVKYVGGSQLREKELEQFNILLGFDGLSFHDSDFYAAQVMSMLFGGGMSSRLFQEVRERRGLVYSIYSYSASYMDSGTFGIHAGTGPDQVAELIPVIADEMKKLVNSVTDEEVIRAANQLKAGLLMSMESTTSRMERLGRQMMLFGKPIKKAETIAEIDAVTKADISRFTQGLLENNNLSLGAVGPLKNLSSYNQVSQLFA
jgi:predicted Zn-dependent peptidase